MPACRKVVIYCTSIDAPKAEGNGITALNLRALEAFVEKDIEEANPA